MKNSIKLFCIFFIMCASLMSCDKVPAGNVGVKVYLLGGDKGVDTEVLGPGRYWIGLNEDLFLFPTFTQNYVWTKDPAEGSENDESITFQTQEGLTVNADVGISYHINNEKVSTVFQKYRKGVGEITDVYLRNIVRDAFNKVASIEKVESVYGEGKSKLIEQTQKIVREQVEPIGIVIEHISFVSSLRLPTTVMNALNSKIEATQRAEQRENELREAEAEAQKKIAESTGKAKSTLIEAKATADANYLVAKSLTPELVKYETIKRWDGKLSQVSGQATPFITLK